MKTKTYKLKDVLSQDIRDNFLMLDEDGKWNFYLKPAMTVEGVILDFYEVYLGNKFYRTCDTIEDCLKSIEQTFMQNKRGDGLISKYEMNIIEIQIKES